MHQRTGQDVLREVVRGLAPAELEKLDETCRAYAARPYPPQPLHRPAGDPLGDGVQTAVLLPVLVAVVSQILADLASGRIRAGGSRLGRWWRRRRARGTATDGRRTALTSALPELAGVTPQELTAWALAQGRAVRLSPAQAAACAHLVVVAVVRPPAEPAPGPAADSHEADGPSAADGESGAVAGHEEAGPAAVREEAGEVQAPARTPPS
ncbi:hypothetical protein B6E66_18055 [Streptomyces maremycinicus]|nr:hypothetical protein B6E66_18055 [Streptomyces sp. B9173]